MPPVRRRTNPPWRTCRIIKIASETHALRLQIAAGTLAELLFRVRESRNYFMRSLAAKQRYRREIRSGKFRLTALIFLWRAQVTRAKTGSKFFLMRPTQ